LITATATVTGTLGAVWIKSHYDDRTQARQAEQARTAAQAGRRREAYAELVKTARLALRNFRQLRIAYMADAPDIPAVREAVSQAASLAADMNQAEAVAELVGSPDGRHRAAVIYRKARNCADLFQERELVLAATEAGARKLLTRSLSDQRISKQMLFDPGRAKVLCDELGAAIDEFIEAVNMELAQ
jgi:hypothetical protein